MSIIISNITDINKNPKLDGIHKYEVRINDRLICEFEHKREDGLSKCLHRAAEAVNKDARKYELMALERFINEYNLLSRSDHVEKT